MNRLSPTMLQQMLAEDTPMIKERPTKAKIKKIKVATVLRKVVQGHLEAGEINPAKPFTREDMLRLLEKEQQEAQLPTKIFRSYYDAVADYPLGCLWIYLNWDKRPRSTKVGNLFRTIILYDSPAYGTDFMCHYLCRFYPNSQLAKIAYDEIERFLRRHGYKDRTVAGMLKWLACNMGVHYNVTFDVRNHFFHNWELFHKNPKAIFYKVRVVK